jgi:hypothetical protein
MALENQLKNLNRTMDKEMSRTSVFTEKDEQLILAAIKNTSPTRIVKKKKPIIPKLLTAALFAGVLLASYTIVEDYLTPDTTREIKKPETRYAQEFTQTSSMLSYDEKTREVTIKGIVKNATDFDSELFNARVNILNEDLAAAAGNESFTLDVPANNLLKPDELYSFIKVISLDQNIDESALKNAVQVEVYSNTKTLTSFVISEINYKSISFESPVETKKPPGQEEHELNTSTNEQPPSEDIEDKGSLSELEEKYGKKKSPFEKVYILNKNGTFYFNGVTVGMKFEEINHILGPYDEHSISNDELNGHNIARWKIKNADNFYVHYAGDPANYTSRMFTVYLSENEVNELTTRLGEPYYVNKNGYTFYYSEASQQLISINDGSLVQQREFEGYQVSLSFEDSPNLLKNVPPKEQ